ncbi:hypothetical protein ACWCOP_04215 [Maricaulaceae bacterium MS644]
MKTTALFGAVAALALGGAAGALDHHNTGQEMDESEGQTMDRAQSTWGGQDEAAFELMFDSRLQRAFAAIDADSDKSISTDEWGAWQADEGFYAERLSMFDANSDESISWDEYRSATMSLYDTSSLTADKPAGEDEMEDTREDEPMSGESD